MEVQWTNCKLATTQTHKYMAKSFTTEDANALLPQVKSESVPDPGSLVYLLIGPPKFGKTTFFCDVPDALLLAFERGASFQKAFKINIKGWDGDNAVDEDEAGEKFMTMATVSALLEKSDRFPFIIFDTADMAAKMCSDYYCKKNNWQHVSEGGDYGKGYDLGQNTPFRQMVGTIMRTGRGIGFITHSSINTTKFKGGDKVKKETTLPGGIFKFIHTQADVILHGSFGLRQKGAKHHDRILQTAGDDETLAGSRCSVSIPSRYVVDSTRPWEQWVEFFNDPKAAERAEKAYEKAFAKPGAVEAEPEPEPEPTPEPEPEPESTRRKRK